MWEFRAKQLWLTTPLAMKSPVPVVMSYIGTSRPSDSMATMRSLASLLMATPSMERFLVMAGSTVWKNLSASRSPPRNRMQISPLGRFLGSTAKSKPNDSSEDVIQLMISGSVFGIRRLPL